jgi:carbon-monoxide dehydrogenase small subunit
VTEHALRLTVNGAQREGVTEARRTLADFLREDLELTGTHVGCEHGVCGACTVLFNGEPVRSCLLFAVQADGCEITTIEGLAEPGGTLGVLQTAMWDNHSFQCGFCTPGFLVTATALLRNGTVSEAELRSELSGNICRCTGYQSIIEGVLDAFERLGEPMTGRTGSEK